MPDFSFDLSSFASGFGLVITGFCVAWAFGLIAKLLDVAGD